MNFEQGILYMLDLTDNLKIKGEDSGSFQVGTLRISYPGYKKYGDYKLSEKGKALKHVDIVIEIHNLTNISNFNSIVSSLDDVYKRGLEAYSYVFSQAFREKLFWLCLQEDINYPQPMFLGRKLPFQRFYESALVKMGVGNLETVIKRTHNHNRGKPNLWDTTGMPCPSFYI